MFMFQPYLGDVWNLELLNMLNLMAVAYNTALFQLL